MRHPILLFSLLLCTGVRAQKADTLNVYVAPLATVSAYGTPRAANAAPAVLIGQAELQRYDNASLLSGLNRIPGVRFEERATASYRVAIRGASLRAPFGVRNTQVYWNGIPFGDPGGDVPLNFLDAVNIDQVEVIKGPSGGFYGPGTAGTLLLETRSMQQEGIFPSKKRYADAEVVTGSFGYFRADVTVQEQDGEGAKFKQLRLGYQRTDGFRDHSAMDRFTAQFTSVLPGKRVGETTKLHALYTKLDYELPGGLTPEQFADNPRQARPGSADKNASIHYHNLLLGLTNTRRLGGWRAETALYTTGFYFDHPFNFDYKREANLGAGGRFALRRLLRKDLDLTFGAEAKLQYRTGQNFTNPDGTRPGNLNFSDEIFSRERLLFGQLRYTPGAWDLTLGLSSSQLDYTIDRTFNANGNTGETAFCSSRPLALRLAVGRAFGDHYVYLSRADGFSPPTLDEFRTNEGSLNVDLDAEIGTNYELGYRYAVSNRFSVDLNLFYFALEEAITNFTDERGTQLFRNAGQTQQQGLEAAFNYQMTNLTDHKLGISLYGAYTYYRFLYQDFQQGNEDFSGNDIPGAAPHVANLEVSFRLRSGLSFDLFHNYTDAIPLNDANTVLAESFHLLRARLGYTLKGYELFLTGANLLDERMSFGNDLNPAFGNRYFQPAPGRNWQLGVRKCW